MFPASEAAQRTESALSATGLLDRADFRERVELRLGGLCSAGCAVACWFGRLRIRGNRPLILSMTRLKLLR